MRFGLKGIKIGKTKEFLVEDRERNRKWLFYADMTHLFSFYRLHARMLL